MCVARGGSMTMGFRDCLSTPSVFVHHLGVSHGLQETGTSKPPHPDLPNIFCIPSELQSVRTKRPRKQSTGESFELHILRPPETKPALLARGGWCGDRWWCVFGFLMGKPPCFPSMARPGAYPRNETNRGKGTRPLREQRQPTAKSKENPDGKRPTRLPNAATCLPASPHERRRRRTGWMVGSA